MNITVNFHLYITVFDSLENVVHRCQLAVSEDLSAAVSAQTSSSHFMVFRDQSSVSIWLLFFISQLLSKTTMVFFLLLSGLCGS